jgi:hypothetical protein
MSAVPMHADRRVLHQGNQTRYASLFAPAWSNYLAHATATALKAATFALEPTTDSTIVDSPRDSDAVAVEPQIIN